MLKIFTKHAFNGNILTEWKDTENVFADVIGISDELAVFCQGIWFGVRDSLNIPVELMCYGADEKIILRLTPGTHGGPDLTYE